MNTAAVLYCRAYDEGLDLTGVGITLSVRIQALQNAYHASPLFALFFVNVMHYRNAERADLELTPIINVDY